LWFRPKWILVAVAGLLVGGGCQQMETPSVKRARLIAAQYLEVQKELADLEAKIEKLKAEYTQQIQEKEAQIAAYRRKVEALQVEVQQAISERVSQVTAAVLEDNAKLKKEVESLRVQLEQRMNTPPTPEGKPQP
jgi:chromosome segregation ATPase